MENTERITKEAAAKQIFSKLHESNLIINTKPDYIMKKICFAFVAFIIPICLIAQNFTGSYLIHVEDIKKKKGVDMKINIKGEKSCLEMVTEEKAGKFRTIFDTKSQTMTILTEKDGANKFGMVRKMPDESELSDKEANDVKIITTNETKTIESYSCKKLIAETEDVASEMWITRDIGMTYSDLYRIMNRGKGPSSDYVRKMKNYKDIKGFPLEMTITDKKKPDEITYITVKNLKVGSVDNSTFETNGYQMMDMQNEGSGR